MSDAPHAVQLIRSSRHEHPDADAVAMHPNTVAEVKAWAEEYLHMVEQDPGSDLKVVDEPRPHPEAETRIWGWLVLESEGIERGAARFVQFIDEEVSG